MPFFHFMDFIFPHKRRDKNDDREERRATKESTKRRKGKSKEKKREEEPEPPKIPATTATSSTITRDSTKDSTNGTGGSQPRSQPKSHPKSDVLEETSAMAQSEDPDEQHHSWTYDDKDDDENGKPTTGQKFKDIMDKSVRRVRKIGSSNRSKRTNSVISRPIKETTLDRFMERVKARQESRVRSAERVTRESECVFPTGENAVRAEIIAKKDTGSNEGGSNEGGSKEGRSSKEGSKEGSREGGSRETSVRRKGSKPKKEDGEESSKRKARTPSSEKLDEDSKRKTKSPSKEKKKNKRKKKEENEAESPSDSFRSSRSDRSARSNRSPRGKPSPLETIQKIFPDLSKKGRQERKEKKERKKKEKEDTRRRKSREANIFVNGRPFWVAAGKMTAAEKAEMTQDDLPLNAAIILEVRKGNIDLPVLPNDTVIKFDPWAPLEVLQARDETLFNHKMLFANTIRSMINSADYAGTEGTTGEGATGGETPPRKAIHIEFMPHPTFYWNYDRSTPSKMCREVFRWQGEGVA